MMSSCSTQYKNRNFGRSASFLEMCSSSVGLCNSPALILCSRVALTPGQHRNLGPAPVCSGRVYAFQSSSARNGCSWRNCSSASGLQPPSAHAGLFTAKRTYLLGPEPAWPGRSWETRAFLRILLITDGRLRSLEGFSLGPDGSSQPFIAIKPRHPALQSSSR